MNNCFETIIFGSGISAYFAKKENPKALVISNSKINNSILSGGFFRTKGVSKKTLLDSINYYGEKITDLEKLPTFCEFAKNIRKINEFKNSENWKFGFKNKLNFLKEFQKNVLIGNLIDILIKNNKIVGCFIKINKKIEFFYCKSIILCTGGFWNYFKPNPNINPIEIAFNKGAKLKNIEFILFHPFGIKNYVIPTEDLVKSKIFNFKKNREFEIELLLKKKEGHQKLSQIAQKLYSKEKKCFVEYKKKILKVQPNPYYTIGGLQTNKNYQTNIKGLFSAGESACGISGANRIGGIALTESVYSAILASKNSIKYNKKNKFSFLKSINFEKINDKSKNINFEKIYSNFSLLNNENLLKKGLLEAKKQKNLFAIAFFKIAIKRKESRGCFLRKDFKIKLKYQKNSIIYLNKKNKIILKFN